VLSGLWLTEDYIEQFHEYLNQLNPSIESVFSLQSSVLKATPGAKQEIIKLLHILRGIMRGLVSNKFFNLFFDWFYPQYFSVIVEGTLNAFYEDDEIVHQCVKLLCELVNNRNNRVRFDTWNINGLVVFKESAKYVI
jgi:exportin-7